MNWRILLIIIVLGFSSTAKAQELNCQVTVIADRIQTTEKRIFETLQTAIFEFMNNTKWTKDIYQIEERIQCNLLLNLSEKDGNNMRGTLQISSSRPVYKTSYNSSVFNYSDNQIEFTYLENEPIVFSPDQHRTNLSSFLAYYAYIIIGMDYDTFSQEGGSDYFMKAQTVVNNAQMAREPGWRKSEGSKNRFVVVENLLVSQFQPIRKVMYEYHRLGMDMMYEDKESAIKKMNVSLAQLRNVHLAKPNSFPMQLFFLAKAEEIIEVFSAAPQQEKLKLMNLLQQIDPANVPRYGKIMNK